VKRARARSATKQALPPPLPALETLEALEARAAADEPSVDGAWWITHQVVQHVLAVTGIDDVHTGAPLAMPVTELLARIRRATTRGSRPFPRDRVVRAAERRSRT